LVTQAVLSELDLPRALFDVGYYVPSHGPPPVTVASRGSIKPRCRRDDRMTMRPTASLGSLKAFSMRSSTTRALSVTLASAQTLN
jgi:hypothetical protein